MPEGGTLTVKAVEEGEFCRITITDTGLGISEAALQHAT